MELERTEEIDEREVELVQRRAALDRVFEALPVYGCADFWDAVEEPGLALEVLVKCVRVAIRYGDSKGRNRVIEVIFRRTQMANEYWASSALRSTGLQADERKALVNDLFADLCERVIRALIDPQRRFWEENFQHCLRFERQHAYYALMVREGHRGNRHAKQSERVPRTLIESLDRAGEHINSDGEVWQRDIEDKRAQQELLAVEHADLMQFVLRLPERLRMVVLLVYWEGRSIKDVAQIVGITDRSVRNRLSEAARLLRSELVSVPIGRSRTRIPEGRASVRLGTHSKDSAPTAPGE